MEQLSFVLDQFQDKLPNKPYCTNDLDYGLIIRPKEISLKYKYIQPNTPYYLHYLILDLDYEASLSEILYELVGIPLPNLLVSNPDNGRSHILFQLKVPIYTMDAGRPKPILYANAIQQKLVKLFNADPAYVGLVSKNPFSDSWKTYCLRSKPYSLNELAQNLELTWKDANKKVKQDDAVGLGRNCFVFHTVRHWAYKEIRQYRGSTYTSWLDCVIKHCMSVNQGLNQPMTFGEVKGIAKSIARYCWKNDAYCYHEFIDRQTRKGRNGGLKGGVTRSMKYEPLRLRARELYSKGLSCRKIAVELEVSKSVVATWIKCPSEPKSDTSLSEIRLSLLS